jgi:hypothetical protein
MQVLQHYAGWRSSCKKHQGPFVWPRTALLTVPMGLAWSLSMSC